MAGGKDDAAACLFQGNCHFYRRSSAKAKVNYMNANAAQGANHQLAYDLAGNPPINPSTTLGMPDVSKSHKP